MSPQNDWFDDSKASVQEQWGLQRTKTPPLKACMQNHIVHVPALRQLLTGARVISTCWSWSPKGQEVKDSWCKHRHWWQQFWGAHKVTGANKYHYGIPYVACLDQGLMHPQQAGTRPGPSRLQKQQYQGPHPPAVQKPLHNIWPAWQTARMKLACQAACPEELASQQQKGPWSPHGGNSQNI